MGIKTIITNDMLPLQYQKYNLEKTISGRSDTVYIMGDEFVLKLFEDKNLDIIKNELYILNLCKNLKVVQVHCEIFYINNKPALIYKKCQGQSLKNASTNNIKQIALFLKEFHKLTKHKSVNNTYFYSKEYLHKNILKSKNKEFLDIFNSINISLKNDGIIHGDIFLDNTIFKNDSLVCVFDFSEVCNGDFIFELAVVACDWCFDNDNLNLEKINVLLDTYELDIKINIFKEYIKYALLHFMTFRYLGSYNYDDLLLRIRNIDAKY